VEIKEEDKEEENQASKKNLKSIKERRKKNADISWDTELNKILESIEKGEFADIASRTKRSEVRRSHQQERCSKYIGVSKNGNNWQVLITMKKQKTYCGTFETQVGRLRLATL